MIKVDLDTVVLAIKAAFPSSGMPNDWAGGATSACGVVARAIARELIARNPDFDVVRFLEACDIDPDTFTR